MGWGPGFGDEKYKRRGVLLFAFSTACTCLLVDAHSPFAFSGLLVTCLWRWDGYLPLAEIKMTAGEAVIVVPVQGTGASFHSSTQEVSRVSMKQEP